MECQRPHSPSELICSLCGMLTAPEEMARDWTSHPVSKGSKSSTEVLELMRHGIDFDTSQSAVARIVRMTEARSKVFKGKNRRSLIAAHVKHRRPEIAEQTRLGFKLSPREIRRAEKMICAFGTGGTAASQADLVVPLAC